MSEPATYVEPGEFQRDSAYIETRITADGSDGFPVEPGRYRLIVARACPGEAGADLNDAFVRIMGRKEGTNAHAT